MNKTIVAAIRKTFIYAHEDKAETRRCLEQARKYRLAGDKKTAVFYQDLAATYRELALSSNKSAVRMMEYLV